MERRPLAAIACCWILGNGLSCLYDGITFWLLWGGISLMAPLLSTVGRFPWRRLLVLWILFSLGAAYWANNDGSNVSAIEARSKYISPENSGMMELEGIPVQVEGRIVSTVDIDGDRAAFTLRLSGYSFTGESNGERASRERKEPWHESKEKVAVQLRLSSQSELATAASWKRGQIFVIGGTLERPGDARNFGGFDYRNYLRNQRIHWLLKTKGASGVISESPNHFSFTAVLGKVDSLRDRLGVTVGKLFPGWQAGYMKGLIIGLADDLEPEKYAQFTNLGLTHILAISGSHVAINVGLLFGLLRLCRITRETAIWIVLGFVPVYVLLTGFSPSVIRSGIMTMLGLYLLRRGLLKDGLNVLSAAALLMLLWDPYYLLNVSFQLSFVVTAGLIVFVPLLSPYFRWLPERLRGAAAITVAAQLVSFPVTIYYFNQFSLLSLVANMVIVPLVSLIALPVGTAALLASGVWLPLGQWIAYPVRLLNSLTFTATAWLTDRSGFMTYWKSPSLLWITIFYGLAYWLLRRGAHKTAAQPYSAFSAASVDDTVPLPPYPGAKLPHVATLTRLKSSWKQLCLSCILIAGFAGLLVTGYQPANAKGVGHVQFIDVGQGDCALITTPTGINILVDGGGTVSFRKPGDAWRNRKEPFEVGAKTVVPLLKKRGIHRLDAVILTHGDQDHIGGLQAVVEQFPVEALLFNGSLAASATMNKLMATANAGNIPVYAAHQGMKLTPDEATTIEFLAPPDEPVFSGVPYVEEQNHRSLVFRLEMEGASFLFTGDMDVSAERKVLALESGKRLLLPSPVDVLKVAHHGSKTSTSAEWLARLQPKLSIISVGASNSYGHPNAGVMERLERAESFIYRTDLQGEIQVKVKSGTLWIRRKLE
ncbi:competence protein ComEC [Fontibacillus phaseoli]|uniref:Competence protein ComEC n=1 Tax=Fontibacillus phaseoli TaxID=1416533 RepID=A0A369BMB0_9BACL|nr:DNA internalization-related competence protein ComEC/Rec2 [Fontibacillus phaseoli]RCX22720.1 competence protein ComEC [Fontibacillus phaseoli]